MAILERVYDIIIRYLGVFFMLKVLFLSTVGLPVFALLVVLSVAVIVSVVYNLFFKNRY